MATAPEAATAEERFMARAGERNPNARTKACPRIK